MAADERAENKAEKASGSIKETAGKLTGDKETQSEGAAEKNKAAAKDKVEDAKESVKGAFQGLKNDDK